MRKKKEKITATLFVILFSLSIFITDFSPISIFSHASTVANQISIASTSSVVDAIAVWQHGETGAQDISYSIWDDTNSQWWTPSSVQASPIAELAGNDVDPNIAFDHEGNAIAVWSHETGNASLDYDIWYSKWSGYSWTPPTEVASLTGDDADPAVAFDTNGWAIAIWVHNGTYIYYSLWNGTNWIGPAQAIVSDWPAFPFFEGSDLPEIAFTSRKANGYTSNKAVAIWTQSIIYPEVPPLLLSRIYYAIWDGTGWSPSPAEEISGQMYDAARDGIPTIFRNGISSDNINNAVAVWATDSITQPVYYAVWDDRIWGDATALDAEEAYGYMPAIAFDTNNDAILTFAHNTTNIWHSKYVGSVWQPADEVADSGGDDSRPSIAFLVNNRAVVVWTRDVEALGLSEIYYSVRDPVTGVWTTAASVVASEFSGSDSSPSIASTSGSPTMPPTTVPPEIHDVAVIDVNVSKTVAAQGYPASINVTVENQGTTTETFDVTAYYNTSSLTAQTVTNLAPGSQTTLTYIWNTTDVSYGNYTTSAVADTVLGEIDTADNTLSGDTVYVTIPGDLNADGYVDVFDVVLLSTAYGSMSGDPNWNPNADINDDGFIDVFDVVILSTNWTG